MITTPSLRPLLVGAAVAALLLAGCSSDSDSDSTGEETTATSAAGDAAAYEGELVGTFVIDAADCPDKPTSGSYFRMVQSGGTSADGPFVDNADSVCGDTTYTGLTPGVDGGLITGDHQPAPDPAFDDAGNATAEAIFEPVTFFAVDFGGATDPEEAVPTIEAVDGELSGDLSAFTAYYGGGNFNQGAPKPDGSGDGPTGTIDPATGAFVIEWTSLISGGSFDGFTGVWHLEGTFEAS